MSDYWFPMPGERHPSLPNIDPDQVELSAITYVVPGPMKATFDKPESPSATSYRTGLLEGKKCAGPAPYVGRPFIYVWRAFVTLDGTNRALAGEAKIVYMDGRP